MSKKERLIYFLCGCMPFVVLLIAIAKGWIII